MFWDLATILKNDYVYTFTNVLLKNENGKIITKSFATEVLKQEKSSIGIKFDSCINITEASINCQYFSTWADIKNHDMQNAQIKGKNMKNFFSIYLLNNFFNSHYQGF